jgi:hypothetical protein
LSTAVSARTAIEDVSVIIHVVVFKFANGVSWNDPRALEAERISLGHPQHIGEILRWTAGRNSSTRPDAYDFGVIGHFANRDSLRRYMMHPDHQRGIDAWSDLSTWIVVDIEQEKHYESMAATSQLPSWV